MKGIAYIIVIILILLTAAIIFGGDVVEPTTINDLTEFRVPISVTEVP